MAIRSSADCNSLNSRDSALHSGRAIGAVSVALYALLVCVPSPAAELNETDAQETDAREAAKQEAGEQKVDEQEADEQEAADREAADREAAEQEADGDTPEEESEDEISIDADGSLAVPDKLEGRTGWAVQGDIRALGATTKLDTRDGDRLDESDIFARARLGISRSVSANWRISGRLAWNCAADSCRPSNLFEDGSIAKATKSVEIDEAFAHWYRSDRLDVAVGRMQTKFVTKGGVFAKSLDRNDSNNTRITWTDGAHGTLHFENGWESHLILQYNPEDGPSQVLREPLDFSSSDSRVSAFASFMSEQPVRYLTQRAVDVTYLPAALKKDGLTAESRVEDYWGLVARMAGRVPKQSTGIRFRFSVEVGYAPNTPTKSGVDLPGQGEVDGTAIAITTALMDFVPTHSIGLNYARTSAGWLLSPQYNRNEELLELRYVWVVRPRLTFDARIRRRQDIDQLVSAVRKRDEFDVFLRLTWRFQAQWPTLIN